MGLGCGPKNTSGPGAGNGVSSDRNDVILIATERSDRGGRLIGVSIDGTRQSELTELAGKVIIDRSPIVSPGARWILFSSNRDRDGIEETSLWRMPLEGGQPTRLTKVHATDRDPRLSADGQWLYFCSNRSGSFDLYRAPFNVEQGTMGVTSLVVHSEGQILSPSISPSGAAVVFMEVDGAGSSRLWRASTDGSGALVVLTEGPSDMTPAWGPDGTLAFAARAPGRADADIYLMPAKGGKRELLLDTPMTDETGPRWSRDGRYLFAIGMYRSATDGKPLLGSLIALDRNEHTLQWRALHDSAVVETRIGLALVPGRIDAQALHKNKNYKEALKAVLIKQALHNESQRSREK